MTNPPPTPEQRAEEDRHFRAEIERLEQDAKRLKLRAAVSVGIVLALVALYFIL